MMPTGTDPRPRADRPRRFLLGAGAFGALAARELRAHAEVLVRDPRLGGASAPLEAAGDADAVVLCVPVQSIERACEELSPHLCGGVLVCDVASVKTLPMRWMHERLPAGVRILGLHPLFGPQTAVEAGTIAGQRVALCAPEQGDRVPEPAATDRVRALLSPRLGLRLIETTADEHDRQMAMVQVLTHLVGHAAREMDLPELPLATVAYTRLLQMKRNTEGDTPELFEAIQRLNSHASDARERFEGAVHDVLRRAHAE